MLQKQQLRELISQRIAEMSAKDRAAESRSVCRRVLEELSSSAQHDITICSYSPIGSEVDITCFNEELLQKNVPLYFPRMEGGKNVFRRVYALNELTSGFYDIKEPSADAEPLPSSSSIIAIIPGRAFDRKGGRLGRGNGGFDHWIANQRKINPQMQCWGVCFECQLLADIPMEEHDQSVDLVFTARGKVAGNA
jgi:5-formyltetrahydrofolate cyclo-ligase